MQRIWNQNSGEEKKEKTPVGFDPNNKGENSNGEVLVESGYHGPTNQPSGIQPPHRTKGDTSKKSPHNEPG